MAESVSGRTGAICRRPQASAEPAVRIYRKSAGTAIKSRLFSPQPRPLAPQPLRTRHEETHRKQEQRLKPLPPGRDAQLRKAEIGKRPAPQHGNIADLGIDAQVVAHVVFVNDFEPLAVRRGDIDGGLLTDGARVPVGDDRFGTVVEGFDERRKWLFV